jgi:hypothetical protein
VITLSETWLKSSCASSSLKITGFQEPFRKDRADDSGYGGVLAWVANGVAAKRRIDLELKSLEALWLEVRTCNNKFLLCTIYRPPNVGNEFWGLLQESLDMAKASSISYLLITGDLNADPIPQQGQQLCNFLEANHLMAHIGQPTRISPTSATILDQFISNMPNFIHKTYVEPPVSTNDHCTIGIKLLFRIRKRKAYSRVMWDFKKANWDNFRQALTNAELDNHLLSEDVNICCENLTEAILEVAKSTIPNKVVVIRPNDKPWYTDILRRLCRVKDRLHNKAKAKKSNEAWASFRFARNTYFEKIKAEKTKFENIKYTTLVEEGKHNSKKWWHILKSLLGQTNDSEIPPLDINGEIITSDKEKATAFNDFFANAAQLVDNNVEMPGYLADTDASLDSTAITEQDVMDQLASLEVNKAYGSDGLSPRILKEGRNVIGPLLCKLFNLSLEKGNVPLIWTRANVVPIHKRK